MKHWNVFEDEQQLRIFLEVIYELSSIHIYIEEDIKHGEEVHDIVQDDTCFNNHIESHKVLQLKNDSIPKYLIPLEKLYDQNYVPTNPAIEPNDESTEDCNAGTKHEPKFIKLSKDLTPKIRKKYIDLFK